jgi:hypothetical protein
VFVIASPVDGIAVGAAVAIAVGAGFCVMAGVGFFEDIVNTATPITAMAASPMMSALLFID